jgi:hypothetical protein
MIYVCVTQGDFYALNWYGSIGVSLSWDFLPELLFLYHLCLIEQQPKRQEIKKYITFQLLVENLLHLEVPITAEQ